jgi:phosphatidylserine/phosphatidylglycerophosphate/cardiolipin synthase-like enzyme
MVLWLLLIIAGCGPSTVRRAAPEPAVQELLAPPIDSPLLVHARTLLETEPGNNYLALMENGQDALLARINLIRAAQSHIAIQTIIWANDETGRLFMYELIQAAKRGVRVQFLIDHLASEQHIEIANFLAYIHPNFEIKLFNPVPGLFSQPKAKPLLLEKLSALLFRFHHFNHRMHNKTFLVDSLVGITGGRNYQNAYFDQAPGMNYKDRDTLCIGPVVREMQASFQQYWDSTHSVSLAELQDVKAYKKQNEVMDMSARGHFLLNGLFEKIDDQVNSPEQITQRFVATLSPVRQVTFIADEPVKRERLLFWYSSDSIITRELARLVSAATSSVYIQTPYLVLTSPAISLFKRLRKNHPEIDIRISTNSLAATDSWHVYALSYKQKQTYLQDLEFRIYEFKPLPADLETFLPNYVLLQKRSAEVGTPEKENEEQMLTSNVTAKPYLCLHGKSLVVDDEIAFVGSYNLDPRSENINTEAGLVVHDPYFARQLRAKIVTDMAPRNAWVIAPKKRPLGLSQPNALLARISNLIPLVDLWPFRYSSSFALIEGKPVVDINHPDFYENFRDVGSFPQINAENGGKEIGARGTKAFLSFVKPLL